MVKDIFLVFVHLQFLKLDAQGVYHTLFFTSLLINYQSINRTYVEDFTLENTNGILKKLDWLK